VSGTLPDLSHIRRNIPIADVLRELGVRLASPKSAHCWRTDRHQNGDRSPSISIWQNKVKCHVCDGGSMSVIDLVIKYRGCSLREAVAWICGQWTVPTIPKNQKLSRPERWKGSPVGLSSFPLEDLVRSGFWGSLDDAGRAVLPVLFCFAEKGVTAISYRGLSRYSGKASDSTIAKVLRRFEQIGLLKALPKTIGNFREVKRYFITLDNSEFQALLHGIHERTKVDRDGERLLRSELKTQTPTPTANPKPRTYPGTSLSTTVECERHARSTVMEREVETLGAMPLAVRASKQAKARDRAIENKATCKTPHSTSVKRGSRTDFNFGWNAFEQYA